ncbi:MAG: FAD-binding oxidoreductase [Candidatus Korarchaeota archaeon]|nr:FAD-binding oxidoreductase [Candidatus Korarchaeota archaeon]NIU82716.1 FAD-binding protein [Candidatus Thorarchaeota archaeon]NIW13207.1 FAD-binding protein [Candidatus Thorarchaeota archaeon]NIW51346.1 FAD-binding protein [Candidatus Korarchaeota archaeon]
MYSKVDKNILDKLRETCGNEYVLTDKSQMMGFKGDETAALEKRVNVRFPEAVVKPGSTEEVSMIMTIAYNEGVPVTPRGGGTGLSGGVVPIHGGIVLSLERLDNIIEIDTENLMAVVEAGVTLEALYDAVEEVGLYFPPHPGDEGAHIGGSIAANAGGARCVRYGVIRNYVQGMKVVLPKGDILNLKGKLLKNNTGYALRHLLIGSEGTLGIITEATLRLMPSSIEPTILVAPYKKREDAVRTIPEILRSGIIPLGVEYIEKEALTRSEKHLDRSWPTKKGAASLMIMVSGRGEEEILSKSQEIMEICEKNNAIDVFLASEDREKENVMEIRSKIYDALKEDSLEIFDITVPPSKIVDFMKKVEEVSGKYDLPMPAYGHGADGNIHVHVMNTDMETYEKIKNELFKKSNKLGGVITGEHGVGVTKIDDLHFSRSDKELELMRTIKSVFDPKNILNTGKVVPGPFEEE